MTEQPKKYNPCPWRVDVPKKFCGLCCFNKCEIAEMFLVFGLFAGFFLGLATGGML